MANPTLAKRTPRDRPRGATAWLSDFLRLESAGGLLLAAATVAALVVANTPLGLMAYDWVLELHLTIKLGDLGVDKPLQLWINDALMVLFFMLVGLELKREVVDGQLSSLRQVVLPTMAALGGLVGPALIYLAIAGDTSPARDGWAIPVATDIAFALAVLGVMGSRVPLSLKVFLATIAIVDDLAAIVIIALFYTSNLSVEALLLAALGVFGLFLLHRFRVMALAPYMLIGASIWFCVLKSGVHATLAGVVVAAFIPLRGEEKESPARRLEHMLHPWVAFAVLPIFAFANAGVSFLGLSPDELAGPVTLGIVAGLVLGKQLGVLGMIALARLLRIADLPAGTTWGQVYGVSVLCGVGFTMSLFIGTLAFEHGGLHLMPGVKFGVIIASIMSAGWALVVLHLSLPRRVG